MYLDLPEIFCNSNCLKNDNLCVNRDEKNYRILDQYVPIMYKVKIAMEIKLYILTEFVIYYWLAKF